MRIRHAIYRQIIEKLDSSRFSAADFLVESPDTGEVLLRVVFRPNDTFRLSLVAKDNKTALHECPAEFYFSGVQHSFDRDDLVEAVRLWVERLYHELRAMTPVDDDFEELRQQLESKLKEHAEDSNSHFTEDEAEHIRQKIKDFDEVLSAYAEKHVEFEAQINSLKNQLQAANATVESFSKKVWYTTYFNKMAKGLTALEAVA